MVGLYVELGDYGRARVALGDLLGGAEDDNLRGTLRRLQEKIGPRVGVEGT